MQQCHDGFLRIKNYAALMHDSSQDAKGCRQRASPFPHRRRLSSATGRMRSRSSVIRRCSVVGPSTIIWPTSLAHTQSLTS